MPSTTSTAPSSAPTTAAVPAVSAGAGYSVNPSTIVSGASQLATQAMTTRNVTSLIHLPQVGPATGSPAAAAAWTVFEAVLTLKIGQLGSGMASDAGAMQSMISAYGRTEGVTTQSLQQTGSGLGGSGLGGSGLGGTLA